MNKKIMLFLLILVSVCAITHVSAADSSDFIASDNTDIQVQAISEVNDDASQSDAVELASDENSKISANNEEYRYIQYLIDTAEEGNIIELEGKNYTCDYLINVNKTVTIDGNGAIIKYNSSNDNTPFFNVEGSNVVLKNMKFIGSNFLFGGAITWQGDNGLLDNCEFKENIANSIDYGIGGALLVLGENLNVTNCNFTNNRAYQHGGAISWQADNGIIKNCMFTDNQASGDSAWAGALLLQANNCTVENCIFSNNHCTDYGGAIAVHNNTNRIVNCEFNNNYIVGKVNISSNESKFIGGGAVFSTCSELIIDNCTFNGNLAPNGLGGAISLGIRNTVKNSSFTNNSALYVNSIFATGSSSIISNFFQLAYMETVADAISGINETMLLASNNVFNKTKINSSVTFSAGMIFEYTRSGSITVKVEGGTLELKNIQVLNHPEAKISYSNNLLTVSGLDVGSYILRVTTTPDEYHNSVDGDLSITVNPATAVIQASQLTVALKRGTLWTVKIVDPKTNAPIPGMLVTLKVYTGNKFITVNTYTDSNGEANYQTKGLSKGTHTIIVSATHSGYVFNTLTSSIKVIKPKALTFKIQKRVNTKKGSLVSFIVKDKKTKKGVNGVKLKLLIYTGKTYITINLKTKKVGKFKGAVGYSTNKPSVGKHKIVIMPESIAYSGSKTTSMTIKAASKKYPAWETKVSG